MRIVLRLPRDLDVYLAGATLALELLELLELLERIDQLHTRLRAIG